MKKCNGFTLVELLVVISIIALLLSVLMPALNSAREQGKILVDAANCKQVGTLVNVYQADCGGKVPIVLNRWVTNGSEVKAKHNYVSLGLRDYWPSTKDLKSKGLDPEGTWGLQFGGRMKDYVTKYMPKFYACPFIRGKTVDTWRYGDGKVTLGSVTYSKQTFRGRFDSFSTALYGRNVDDHWPAWATGLKCKYAALPWNSTVDNGLWPTGKFDVTNQINWSGKKHLSYYRDGSGSYMPLRITSLSETTIMYCVMGESRDYDGNLSSPNIIFNYKSHRKSGKGGTNAVFADGHAAWVQGDQIGWH